MLDNVSEGINDCGGGGLLDSELETKGLVNSGLNIEVSV